MDNMKGLGSALPAREGGGKKGKKPPQKAPEEEEEDPDFEVTETNVPGLSKQQLAEMMRNVASNGGLASALQEKLDGMVGRSSGYLESLPGKVKRRIEGLKKLQEEHDDLEEKFLEERRALEKKYEALYQPLYKKRSAVVTGAEDVEHPADDTEEALDEEGKPITGVPDFWLNAFRNNEVLEEQITEKDAAVLSFLTDVRSEQLDGEDEKGFRLVFDFKENPFFTNTALTKTYCMVDEDDPILEKAIGTEINWHPGKNITVKVMKKKPKKGSKNAKPVTKTEQCESFFNFFSPPKVPEEDDEAEEEEMEALQDAMEQDYEMGAAIRERIIPQAVNYYTGEANEEYFDDDDEEDDGEEGEDEDEEDEDDEEEEEEKPKKKKGGKGGGKGPAGATAAGGEQPAECKNQ